MDARELHRSAASNTNMVAATGQMAPPATPVIIAPPLFNLLTPAKLDEGPAAAPIAEPTRLSAHRAGRSVLLIIVVLALLGGAAGYALNRPTLRSPSLAVHVTPTASTTPVPTPTVMPSPSPLPEITPIQNTVTLPAVMPTLDRPQTVIVKNKTGLWLRSAPSSLTQKNIIAWIPQGGQVSVDATGAFWWHGSYAGRAGYFAVGYTK